MDKTTIIGLLLVALVVVGGQYLEGGSLAMIFQVTAAVIVLGGTLGAVCLSFPPAHLLVACRSLSQIFFEPKDEANPLIAQITEFAYRSRREGILSLERELDNLPDDFFRRTLQLVVDGLEPETIRDIMEIELRQLRDSGSVSARVFESAGGYAPTMGILGAVFGLIQVMNYLTEPSKLGPGIAVAFVATVYGVGSANLLFLPIAHKLQLRHQRRLLYKELVLEGVLGVSAGIHPRLIEERLIGLLAGWPSKTRRPFSTASLFVDHTPADLQVEQTLPAGTANPEPGDYATPNVTQN
ncbi:MAG: flagellar motor protein [Deltaproteobacteria bacterium]|nr:MAG: flagellar motor protein [Deltaproteobacteria bacterium]